MGGTGVVISSECPFHSEIDGFLPFFYPRDGIKRSTTSTIYLRILGTFTSLHFFRIDAGKFNKSSPLILFTLKKTLSELLRMIYRFEQGTNRFPILE